jgi:hypothetical protein
LFFSSLLPVLLVSVFSESRPAAGVEASASLAADEAVLGLSLQQDIVCSSIRRVLKRFSFHLSLGYFLLT